MTASLRWTEEQLAAHRQRGVRLRLNESFTGAIHDANSRFGTPTAPERPQASPADRVATHASPRGMNKLEAQYAQRLDLEKHGGEILWWGYEAIRLGRNWRR